MHMLSKWNKSGSDNIVGWKEFLCKKVIDIPVNSSWNEEYFPNERNSFKKIIIIIF